MGKILSRTKRMAPLVAFALVSAFPISASMPRAAWADKADLERISASRPLSIALVRGKTKTMTADENVEEIVVGDPEIASVTPMSPNSFYIRGNKVGTTSVVLFDVAKNVIGTIDVEITIDSAQISTAIREATRSSAIKVRAANGGVVISGTVPDAVTAEKARRIAEQFTGEGAVINSLNIDKPQQVQLNVRFVEINRQASKALGAKIGTLYSSGSGSLGLVSSPNVGGSTSPAAELIGSLIDGGFSIDVAIDALEDKGVARRLAEPNLIARSGETASFLAGGEFPIPVSEDEGRVTVSYKQFGVGLNFTPTVLDQGLISLDIEPEVSSIDPTASYRVGEIAVPGFTVRRAKTSIDLKSGQSFMVAGLLQNETNMISSKVPGIGNLPVLGALFSSKSFQRRETDLVIIVTPHLAQPIDPTKKAATPTDKVAAASDTEFFFGNKDEVKKPGGPVTTRTSAAGKKAVVYNPSSGHYLDF